MGKIKVTLKKSMIACKPGHRLVVASLGLHKIGNTVIHDKSPAIMGMIAKISYLLSVEDIEEVKEVKKRVTKKKTEQEVTE